ncbi:hypothetical protein GGI20_006332, partial [Coemansia sp. BCRC 34301]
NNSEWIRWNTSESSIEIADDFVMLKRALTNFGFHPKTASSAKKNFTDYGFASHSDGRRMMADANDVVWAKWSHKHFNPDKRELLKMMRRKAYKKKIE